jgi:glycerophosphoryl diester phosphodiesterase
MKESPAQSDPTNATAVPISVSGPHGPIRLKWHQLRTRRAEAPFRRSNLALGWQLGASLEIDVLVTADHRFVVAHDATLGPSTTGRGRLAEMPLSAVVGALHRDGSGAADPDAPLLPLADFLAPLLSLGQVHGATIQLDLKVPEGYALAEAAKADPTALGALAPAIVVGSQDLAAARRLAAAIPGARLGYDPMRAASRNPILARDPRRLLRHLERQAEGVAFAYLRLDVVAAAEVCGFPLVGHLLDLGIETDAWTVNPGPALTDLTLHALVQAKVRQITTDEPAAIARRIAAL